MDNQNPINEPPKKHIGGFNTHPENINRKGAPRKGTSWRALTDEALKRVPDENKGKTVKEMIIGKLIVMANNDGDLRAIDMLIRLVEGYAPVKQTMVPFDEDEAKSEEELLEEYEALRSKPVNMEVIPDQITTPFTSDGNQTPDTTTDNQNPTP